VPGHPWYDQVGMSAADSSWGVPLEAGAVLAKKYRVEARVGEGGTGVVLAATHIPFQQKVAIKVLRTALASDEIRLRFEREARAIERIQSEHVVLVLDVGALADGSPYMVMEYLEGRDLARVLREDGPLAVEDAVDCMLQVCEALGEAHGAGIVHRDLKPANLFLTRNEDGDPHVKVVDFGISKILDPQVRACAGNAREVTSAGAALGSPRYMAPEQLRSSRDVDGRADLWSVGAVLFQLVTGRHAFEAPSNVQATVKVLSEDPASLCEHAPHAPPALERIVRRCLEKERDARFQTAAELAEALRPLASARTRTSLERLRLAKDNPIAAGVDLVVDAAMGSGGEPLHVGIHPSSQRPGREAGGREASERQMPTAPTAFSPRSLRETRSPASRRRIQIAIGLGSVTAILVVFGVLSAVKLAAEATGIVPSALGEPDTSLAGAAGAGAARPLVSAPVTSVTGAAPATGATPLDAGLARP
jgi:eukaryotic-like serine/threonine-protein kinase